MFSDDETKYQNFIFLMPASACFKTPEKFIYVRRVGKKLFHGQESNQEWAVGIHCANCFINKNTYSKTDALCFKSGESLHNLGSTEIFWFSIVILSGKDSNIFPT